MSYKNLSKYLSQVSSLNEVGDRQKNWGLIPGGGVGVFIFTTTPRMALGLFILLSSGCRELFSRT
jgi:hypothetical protein